MGLSDRRTGEWLQDIVMYAAISLMAYYGTQQMLRRLDPDAGTKAEAQRKSLAASSRLQSIFSAHERQDHDRSAEDDDDGERAQDYDERPGIEELTLSSYEETIAGEVISPKDIPVSFDDIGGLDSIIEELREGIIYPLTMPHLYTSHSSLLSAPSGVLLYGPPGCGKTMLAKALAKESGACFINLHISTLTEKWYGDSNKLVAAVFSLARKLQPTIVFIDEIDAVLGQRRSGEHEASGMVKAEFMTHWDGLASSTSDNGAQRICILGATNRIQDIDEAILRRMPKKFPVGLPTAGQRRQIFELTLKDTKVDRTRYRSGGAAFDLDALVRMSAGMSGSDIKEACRDAAMVPVREYIKKARTSGQSMRGIKADAVRGLQTDDFFGRSGGLMQPATRETAQQAAKDLDGDDKSDGSGSTEEVDDFREVEGVEVEEKGRR